MQTGRLLLSSFTQKCCGTVEIVGVVDTRDRGVAVDTIRDVGPVYRGRRQGLTRIGVAATAQLLSRGMDRAAPSRPVWCRRVSR